MATFTPIRAEEMDQFLGHQGFTRVALPGVRELVYGKRYDLNGLAITMRVYSGINPDGASREKGTDAIRVSLFWRRPDGEVRQVAGSARVHRVQGWKANLASRIGLLGSSVIQTCECGAPMVERKGPRGKFYGCAAYPVCRKTRPSAEVGRPQCD